MLSCTRRRFCLQKTDPLLPSQCLGHMESVHVQWATNKSVVFHPLHNKSDGEFDSGSTVVDIYDAVNGARLFKYDNGDKLHVFDLDWLKAARLFSLFSFPEQIPPSEVFGEWTKFYCSTISMSSWQHFNLETGWLNRIIVAERILFCVCSELWKQSWFCSITLRYRRFG